MAKIKTGVSFEEVILGEIDQIAAGTWFCDRSQAITRIYLEWKQLQTKQLSMPVADEPADVSPTAQMRASGAVGLFPLGN